MTISVKQIYVIDDDTSSLEAIEWVVTNAGYAVNGFLNLETFLKHVNFTAPCALIVDVHLKDALGLSLLETLRTRPYLPPMIFITGFGDIPMAVNALKDGAFDFIEKPIDNAHLLNRLAAAYLESEARFQLHEHRQILEVKIERLTNREREVFFLLSDGMGNKHIARELELSVKTIEFHRKNVMEKLEATQLNEIVQLRRQLRETGINP
ncbi:response regulator transcription factor [Hirschia litorea]|uniref:Response regulator transcription factor n=1 Tax=Hirschia litorea TaxID=1199156 RepID=A0ABW2IPV9_9PROT